jgi:hypothetical protein
VPSLPRKQNYHIYPVGPNHVLFHFSTYMAPKCFKNLFLFHLDPINLKLRFLDKKLVETEHNCAYFDVSKPHRFFVYSGSAPSPGEKHNFRVLQMVNSKLKLEETFRGDISGVILSSIRFEGNS